MGPIPARAGEPSIQTPCWHSREAYPRSRGGTSACRLGWPAGSGLSPLARGNLKMAREVGYPLGPIPARAGEPKSKVNKDVMGWAYPRSRGGTRSQNQWLSSLGGLSPLARGNLRALVVDSLTRGPIPARAGEPPNQPLPPSKPRAYPRSRGGTLWLCQS